MQTETALEAADVHRAIPKVVYKVFAVADLNTANGLLIGMAGGLVTLVGQYIIARLIESHKAALAATTKRRERYYEKQDAAVAGLCKTLQSSVHAHMYYLMLRLKVENGVPSDEGAQLLEEEVKKSWAARRALVPQRQVANRVSPQSSESQGVAFT